MDGATEPETIMIRWMFTTIHDTEASVRGHGFAKIQKGGRIAWAGVGGGEEEAVERAWRSMPDASRFRLASYEPSKAGGSTEIVCETPGRPPHRHP